MLRVSAGLSFRVAKASLMSLLLLLHVPIKKQKPGTFICSGFLILLIFQVLSHLFDQAHFKYCKYG